METTINTVRVIQYPAEYDFNPSDALEAQNRFGATMLVTDDGITTTNKDGTPVTAEGGGVLLVVDNRNGQTFPELKSDLYYVMGIRQVSTADWYTSSDPSTRTLQVEPSGGWVADEDQGNYVRTAMSETREELGYPVWSGSIAHRLHNWSTYQPFTGKRICTLGLVLQYGPETRNLLGAARAISEWPESETRYFGDFTGRPLVSHTTKRRIDGKTGKELITVVSETGLRKSLQGLGLVAFSDVAKLFGTLSAKVQDDEEEWALTTLNKLLDCAPHRSYDINPNHTVASVIKLIGNDPIFAERTKEERTAVPQQTQHGEASDVLRAAKRGFNPLASAKALGLQPEGKVPVYLLADTTLQEQDSSSKEPKAKRTRVAAHTSVPAMIRGHVLLGLQSRWADMQKL